MHSLLDGDADYDDLEKDNALFGRRRGKTLVDDVFDRRTGTWYPYTGDRFEKRHRLLRDWAKFCAMPTENVDRENGRSIRSVG
jgi:hypothetical protein